MAIVGEVKIRDDSADVSGIGGAFMNSVISGVDISHTKCGMWVNGPFDGLLISGCSIHDTTADGINFHMVRYITIAISHLHLPPNSNRCTGT